MASWWDCDTVHCGFWNNEDHSFVYRGTLTLPNQSGLVLGGFFTIFIVICTSYLWGIVAFIIHQLSASTRPQDESAPLPSNQWEIEVMNWMNVLLANTQHGIVSFSRRSQYDVGGGVSSLKYIEQPQSPELRGLCNNIKIRSARHTSFSVFAMAATIAVGVLCVLSDLVVRKLFRYFQRRTGHGMYKRQEWPDTSVFQLQRMAAEGRGIGPWVGRDKDVPTLAQAGLLFNLSNASRFGDVARTEYDSGQGGDGFYYRALHKQAAHHEQVELRPFRP